MSDAKTFALEIDREWLAKQEDIAETVAMIGLDALRSIVLRSPVDTGRFRANWDTTVGQVSTTFTQEVDPSGSASINEGAAVLNAYDTLRPIYIQNNLPYSVRLENGWSNQAPQGMVALTVASMNAKYSQVDV